MAITVDWHDPNENTLLVNINGEWSPDEFLGTMLEFDTMMETRERPIVMLIDCEQASFPMPPPKEIDPAENTDPSNILRMVFIAGQSIGAHEAMGLFAGRYPHHEKKIVLVGSVKLADMMMGMTQPWMG